jgi:hypothetical protein
MSTSTITVRTHVARDLLQSAALFKTDKLVVWEYVSNGLQYRDHGVSPVVNVTLDSRKKLVMIDDNGAGMDREGLQNFFVMHGENLERKAGRIGRGRFGTGKSAAFGIADKLTVSSVRDGKRNTVELSRKDIEAAGENEISVKTIERDVPTDEPNGTVVTISKVNLKKFDERGVIKFVERQLAHWRGEPLVTVNKHPCEYAEPAVSQMRTVKPNEVQSAILGDVQLMLKVAKANLDPEMQGVAIHANGALLESTLAGAEGQPMAQYIFGDIDVPALDDDAVPIPAFDMSRSMQLNRSNEVVQTLLAFIGFEVDRLRRVLVNDDKARRAQDEIKKLNREARLIADMINRDFEEFSDRIARVTARSGTGHDITRSKQNAGDNEPDDLTPGATIDAESDRGIAQPHPPAPLPPHPPGPLPPPEPLPGPLPPTPPVPVDSLKPDENGKLKGDPVGGNGKAKRPRGGFSVEFKEMGDENPRASYASAERTIFVNLDHPQIRAAKGTGNIDDPVFQRLAYEVAFSEYAIALATEMDRNGEFIEPSDAMFEIREALNRMARRAAALYAT